MFNHQDSFSHWTWQNCVSDVGRDVSSHWCVVGRMIKNSIKGWSLSASLADRWFQFSSGFRDIPIGSHSHVNLFSFVKVMTTLILIIIDWIVSAWLWSGLCDGSVRGRNVCWLRRKYQPVLTATSRPWAGGEKGRWVTTAGSPREGISDLHRSEGGGNWTMGALMNEFWDHFIKQNVDNCYGYA